MKIYNDLKSATVDGTGLNAATLEAAKADEWFRNTAIRQTQRVQHTATITSNLYRTAYANANDSTKVVSQQTEEKKSRANAALGNTDFRLAVTFATDRAARYAQRVERI